MERRDIQNRLREFSARWADYNGTERSEAQTYCNEFFACFGLDRRAVGARFEEHIGDSTTRADLVWADKLVIEMKRPSITVLSPHYSQLYDYWLRIDPSPKYAIISNFSTIEIHDPQAEYGKPRCSVTLANLDLHVDALAFMIDEVPTFPETQSEVTKKAADTTMEVYRSLLSRYEPEKARLFILQCVYAMFAEDIAILPRQHFTRTLEDCLKNEEKTGDLLYLLFQRMNEPDPEKRRGRDIPYFNGGLFRELYVIDLEKDEIKKLLEASHYDWSLIRPEIFGTLFEHSLLLSDRSRLGAFFTSEKDIGRIVQPTIVKPWLQMVAGIHNRSDLQEVKQHLTQYKVLDATCGSGNFLFVAYRELKRIERMIYDREMEIMGVSQSTKIEPIFPIENLFGIDIDPFAVMLTRVTLWIGQHLINIELKIDGDELPLPSLNNIVEGDALLCDWPRGIKAYIGNPPFLGAKRMKSRLRQGYVETLQKRYPNHGKQADLCTYFFRRVHDEMGEGCRAGLIGASQIRTSASSRRVSLDYIRATGGEVTNAWSAYRWPGEAAVYVCIVNWIRGKAEGPLELDGQSVKSISQILTNEAQFPDPAPLNTPLSRLGFIGVYARHNGFVLSRSQAENILAKHPDYTSVIRPFLLGRVLQSKPLCEFDRYIIDFTDKSLEQVMQYPDLYAILMEKVYPKRSALPDDNYNTRSRDFWWQFKDRRPELRRALASLSRYIAVAYQPKEPHFAFVPVSVLPDHGVVAIASEDPYVLGILSSRHHRVWAWTFGSRLKADLRYTPTTILRTFPFPDSVPVDLQKSIRLETTKLIEERDRLMKDQGIGLTALYDKGFPSIKSIHRRIDRLVDRAYQFGSSERISDDELRRRLLQRNTVLSTTR